MKNKVFNVLAVVAVGLVVVSPLLCYAASTQTVNVRAVVPPLNGLSVSISRVQGTTWTTATSIDFGTLDFDNTFKIFRAPFYYAVDCGVNDNSGNTWTVTHTRTNLANGNQTLNNKVNVNFVRQDDKDTGVILTGGQVSYEDSNNKAYTKTQLNNGASWLRIYYGVGTGSGDNPGVTPIDATQQAGTYRGSVTISLTP
jgi:hypothetical protein